MTVNLTERLQHALRLGGYEVKTRYGLDNLMDTLWNVEGNKAGNPEFDPTLHELDKSNSLWIEVLNNRGEPVATSVARLLEDVALIELMRTYRLWYGEKIHFKEPLKIVVSSDVVIPSGKVVLDGAMWVHPEERRQGFSWILGRLLKATAFQNWDLDWFFGLAFESTALSRLPIYSYGYPRLDPLAVGFRQPGYPCQDISLASMSRAEYIRHAMDNERILAESPGLTVGPELAAQVRAAKH